MNSTQSKSAISIDSDDENFVPPPPPALDADDSDDVDTDDSDDDDDAPPPPPESDNESDDDGDDDNDRIEDDEDKFNFTDNALPQTSSVQQLVPDELINDSDLDDDSDNDENYLQKFDESLQQTIIADHHPEMKSHNYDEIINMSTVTRNASGAIIDPLHRSVPFITRYEKAKLIGERAAQLGAGASPFVEVDENIIDDYMIALKEFEEKKIPFIIKRPMPNGGCEYWRLEDLEILV